MVRTRRKSGVRKTVDCFRRCLNNKVYPQVLKWVDRKEQIFSILFKNKKSPTWTAKHLAMFKELDSLSITKSEKYKNQPDCDQASKRRCKANLRKLCEDGVLERIRDIKIDKCTKEKIYKFSDKAINHEIKIPTDDWINAPLLSDDNFTNFCNNEIGHETHSLENGKMGNIHTALTSNTLPADNKYNEGEYMDKFYAILQTNCFENVSLKNEVYFVPGLGSVSLLSTSEENVDLNPSLNNYNASLCSLSAMEESRDINDLMEMIDTNKAIKKEVIDDIFLRNGCTPNISSDLMETVCDVKANREDEIDDVPLWSNGCTPNISSGLMEMIGNDEVTEDDESYDVPLWSNGCTPNISSEMDINQVANIL